MYAIKTVIASAIILFLVLTPHSFSQNGIQIAYGDHIEMVCKENGLVEIHHSIIEAANKTENVTSVSTYSYKGTLVGDIKANVDPEILRNDIFYKSENGITTIIVNFTASFIPSKIIKFELIYSLRDVLLKENGKWHFRSVFNSESKNPPEIVIKIPKPQNFQKLIIESTNPSPKLYSEESDYFGLAYSQPLFTFGETSSTFIDITYEIAMDYNSIFWWVILTILSIGIGFSIGKFGKGIIGIFSKRKKREKPSFEIYKDRNEKFRFRMKAANGRIISTSEAYESKQACKKTIITIIKTSSKADIEDHT